jgi:hypothetical protein
MARRAFFFCVSTWRLVRLVMARVRIGALGQGPKLARPPGRKRAL